MEIISLTTTILSLGTVVAHVFIVLILLWYFFLRRPYPLAGEMMGRFGLELTLMVATVSMLASLFYSNIAGFAPCELCWFQRIFMYPLVIILAMALIRKDKNIIDYALALSGVGFLISLVQNYMYYFNSGLAVYCQQGGATVSCVKRYVFEFGYISIPIMALTSFVLVIIFLLLAKRYSKKS